VPEITIYHIADGQVIEEQGIVDNMSLMSQLHEER
jgi:predicted ester cyclase